MATKNINACYDMNTGHWVIHNNGKIILEGEGVFSYGDAIINLSKTATKKVKDHTISHWDLAVKEAQCRYPGEEEEVLYWYEPEHRNATEQEVQQYEKVDIVIAYLPDTERHLIFDYAYEAVVSPNEKIEHPELLHLLQKYNINPDDFVTWYYTDEYFE